MASQSSSMSTSEAAPSVINFVPLSVRRLNKSFSVCLTSAKLPIWHQFIFETVIPLCSFPNKCHSTQTFQNAFHVCGHDARGSINSYSSAPPPLDLRITCITFAFKQGGGCTSFTFKAYTSLGQFPYLYRLKQHRQYTQNHPDNSFRNCPSPNSYEKG